MRKITCRCETTFEADLPEEIDLEKTSGVLESIVAGDFFELACPACGEKLKPELRVRFLSKKAKWDFVALPETERTTAYSGKTEIPPGSEILIGYAELWERARMILDGFDPTVIEILKYMIAAKATKEVGEAASLSISYFGTLNGKLGFHIAGLREDSLAQLLIEMDLFKKALHEKQATLRSEPFDRIFQGPYHSIRALEAEIE